MFQRSIPAIRLPLLAITLGDVAGIGPEIIVKGWDDLCTLCRPVVAGNLGVVTAAVQLVGNGAQVREVGDPADAQGMPGLVEVCQVATVDLAQIIPGTIDARAGKAANDFLLWAIDRALEGKVDGIVTTPLHKESLRVAGVPHPGHTEILAERTGTANFAMVLAVQGLAVIHQTLHMPLREVFSHLQPESISAKARLLDALLIRLGIPHPRLGLAALNPHAGEHGLFGDEEDKILRPLVSHLRAEGFQITGPLPADTLFQRAFSGEFDGVVALYHDQGHIALKLAGRGRAVNISAGLPILRTSVAHGTAFDIAWQGKADPGSLVTAADYAARLAGPRSVAGLA